MNRGRPCPSVVLSSGEIALTGESRAHAREADVPLITDALQRELFQGRVDRAVPNDPVQA